VVAMYIAGRETATTHQCFTDTMEKLEQHVARSWTRKLVAKSFAGMYKHCTQSKLYRMEALTSRTPQLAQLPDTAAHVDEARARLSTVETMMAQTAQHMHALDHRINTEARLDQAIQSHAQVVAYHAQATADHISALEASISGEVDEDNSVTAATMSNPRTHSDEGRERPTARPSHYTNEPPTTATMSNLRTHSDEGRERAPVAPTARPSHYYTATQSASLPRMPRMAEFFDFGGVTVQVTPTPTRGVGLHFAERLQQRQQARQLRSGTGD
jgi:hypothetical protein